MTDSTLDRSGVIAALAAFGFWGLAPIYFQALRSVSAWEVLAHRVLWSVPILLLFLGIRDRGKIWSKLHLPLKTVAWLFVSASLIAINWLVFVWAVANEHILDTSLGYFSSPLLSVMMGFLILKESVKPIQVLAIIIAAAGTVYLAWYLGRPPWIAITLALSFSLYGLVRKRLAVGPMLGLLWEAVLILLPAMAYVTWLSINGNQKFLQGSLHIDFLLIGSGLITVLPLIWFNVAAKKLPLSILGFFNYISPCISFLVAVFLFGETFTHGHAVAFICIWSALALVSTEQYQRARKHLKGTNVS
jgi:chloramphenicol-sensitive protein RarD